MLSPFCFLRFRDMLEFDTVVVHAMGSNHQISTYRLLAISEKYYKVKKQSQAGKKRVTKYDWKGKEVEQRRETLKETSKACTKAWTCLYNVFSILIFTWFISLYSHISVLVIPHLQMQKLGGQMQSHGISVFSVITSLSQSTGFPAPFIIKCFFTF